MQPVPYPVSSHGRRPSYTARRAVLQGRPMYSDRGSVYVADEPPLPTSSPPRSDGYCPRAFSRDSLGMLRPFRTDAFSNIGHIGSIPAMHSFTRNGRPHESRQTEPSSIRLASCINIVEPLSRELGKADSREAAALEKQARCGDSSERSSTWKATFESSSMWGILRPT